MSTRYWLEFPEQYLEMNHSVCHVNPEVDLAGTLAFEFSVVLPCSPDLIAFEDSTTRSLY